MKTIIFMWYLITGTIVPSKEVDGRQTYHIYFNQPTKIIEGHNNHYESEVDYAYKGEIFKWIENGTFEYNEDEVD